jgi:hypothetical protein
MSKRTKDSDSGESEEDSKQSEEEAISSEESSEDEEAEKLTASKKIAAAEAKKKKKAAAAKPKSKKSRKDAEGGPPKKPTTAYVHYLRDKRPEFQAKFADLKFGDLSKKISAAWKSLNETDKKPYQDKYLEEKKSYTVLLENYKKNKKPSTESEESSEDSSPKKRKKKKKKVVKKKIPGAPKQATNAYMYFQSAEREKIKKENPTLKTLPQMAKKNGRNLEEHERRRQKALSGIGRSG